MWSRSRKCWLKNYGLIEYTTAWNYQRSLVTAKINNPNLNDILLLLEHPPVYTLGTGSTTDYLKFDPQQPEFTIYRTERGGEVTYHCPHQLVSYPILDLRHYQQDLHWYLRQLEAVIIQAVANYDLKAERIAGLTGVWLSGKKIAAVGIKVKRWITMHGFAVNVCPDLSGFERIIPCGIADKPVGSLAEFVPEITVEGFRQNLLAAFADVFEVELIEIDAELETLASNTNNR